jgi:hypothetical protein
MSIGPQAGSEEKGHADRASKDRGLSAGNCVRDRSANVVNWPEIISSIKSIEVLTPGPIRAGTRLREDRIMFGRGLTQELEIATIERPHRLRLLAKHPDLHYELDHVIDAVYGGPDDADLSKQTCDADRTGFAASHVTVHGNYIA